MANERDNGGPAFPHIPTRGSLDGMSLRDCFAGQALPAAMERDYGTEWGKDGKQYPACVARECYRIADALLEARAK